MKPKGPSLCLVSACLVGLCTRYDGETKATASDIFANHPNTIFLPVCPEQLGGLPTPREAADIIGGDGHDVLNGRARVLTKSGKDVTDAFLKGAGETLKIARLQNATRAILKARSPSCGASSSSGVTAALLERAGIAVTER